jgi:release factor glutamine methyltransferase
MKLCDWLRKGEADLLTGPHPDRARRDAEMLLLHHIGKNRAWLLTHLDEDFGGCKAIAYAAVLKRRLAGEPIQYITGECEFFGLSFHVTPAVLIPRPETEHLVEAALAHAANLAHPHILDVGTGSGAIAVSLAKHLTDAQITGTDISSSALDLAKENAKRHNVAVRFLQGNLLAPVAGETFDLIVSNPPYVPKDDSSSLSVEVRDYEPAEALFAGPDGLSVYRRLIPEAYAALAPGGYLALEIGFGQADAIADLMQSSGFSSINFTFDLQGILRVAIARRD